jgi:hypothetical protein
MKLFLADGVKLPRPAARPGLLYLGAVEGESLLNQHLLVIYGGHPNG